MNQRLTCCKIVRPILPQGPDVVFGVPQKSCHFFTPLPARPSGLRILIFVRTSPNLCASQSPADQPHLSGSV